MVNFFEYTKALFVYYTKRVFSAIRSIRNVRKIDYDKTSDSICIIVTVVYVCHEMRDAEDEFLVNFENIQTLICLILDRIKTSSTKKTMEIH